MAIIKKGTLTVTAGGSAQNLLLGFYPSYFKMQNYTKTVAGSNGIWIAEWYSDMSNATAYTWTVTSAAAPVLAYLSSNGFTPYTSTDSQIYTSTNLTITGISKAANASITATHAFTADDVGVTTVSFHNVSGMTQINTLSGVIQSITSTTSFTVNIDSTSFTTYSSGGIANIVTGNPALQGGSLTSGNALGFSPNYAATQQVLNTALFNQGSIGLTLGSSLMVTTSDVWEYVAYLDAPFTSA